MKQKPEVLYKLKQFEAIMANASAYKIAKIRSDNGDVYILHAFQEYMKERSIRHELSVAHC